MQKIIFSELDWSAVPWGAALQLPDAVFVENKSAGEAANGVRCTASTSCDRN